MNIYLGEPNEKQEKALKDTHKYVGYGGARGGGKSWLVRAKAIILAQAYPGIRMLIMRQTYPELKKNHIDTLVKIVVPHLGKYNKSDKQMTFHNGSVIEFQYCRNDADLKNVQGVEYDVIFVDEATHFTEFQLKAIAACGRGVNRFPKRIYYTMNPGGQGHGYIKRIFIDKKYEDGENPEDYSFIQALVQDNVALQEADPEYVRFLEALPPKLKKAWLYGDWNIFEGQFFDDFVDDEEHYEDRRWTHVIDPFDIPAGWKIYRSYDFGYSKPFSCAWWAVDYEGVIYRILELYGWSGLPNEGIKWSPDKQMAEIAKIEKQHPYLKGKTIRGVADPAIWNKSTGESINDTALLYHLYFEKGDNERIAGWMQMHYRFQFDENGYPRMYIFSNCKHFIRTIPLMIYDETNVEDLDTDLEDHVADESRYFCMSRPIKPHMAAKELPQGEDPLNQRLPKRKSIYVNRR